MSKCVQTECQAAKLPDNVRCRAHAMLAFWLIYAPGDSEAAIKQRIVDHDVLVHLSGDELWKVLRSPEWVPKINAALFAIDVSPVE